MESLAQNWTEAKGKEITWDVLHPLISTPDQYGEFYKLCERCPAFGDYVLNEYGWELFDHLNDMLLSESFTSVKEAQDIAKRVCSALRPKEAYILIAEKLSSSNSWLTFSVLCSAFEVILPKCEKSSIWHEGKSLHQLLEYLDNHYLDSL